MPDKLNERERFGVVARDQQPDYVSLFGFPGAAGMSGGCLRTTHERLVATGMPPHVGGCVTNWRPRDVESWYPYWGTTGPIYPNFSLAWGAEGIKSTRREEGGYVFLTGMGTFTPGLSVDALMVGSGAAFTGICLAWHLGHIRGGFDNPPPPEDNP